MIERLKSNDKKAFEELVALHKNSVINTCYRFLLDKEDAEDISQEVFIEIYQSIHSFRADNKISTSYFISTNYCYTLGNNNPPMIWKANYNDEIVYPNPFCRETTIEFSLNKTEKVSISVYNELGQLIKTLVIENSVNPGKFKLVWDGTDNSGSKAANGIYLYSISNQNKVIKSGKIILKR